MKGSRTVAPALAVGFALALAGVLLVRAGGWPEPTRPGRPAAGGDAGFGLASAVHPDRPEAKFAGAVYLTGSSRYAWFGTYVNGDGFVGRVASTPFVLEDDFLDVPILGYPNAPGNALELEVVDATGHLVLTRRYAERNPREIPGHWQVSLPGLRGDSARLVLTDGETRPGGWLGVSRPITRRLAGASWLWDVRRDYGWFGISAFALAGLLFVPGLAWHAWRGGDRPLGVPALALPGLAVLAAFGLGAWLLRPGLLQLPAVAWLIFNLAAALGLARRWWRQGGVLGPDGAISWRVYGCVVAGALAFALLPLGVAQEYSPQTTGRGRMIASPPDELIPFRTACYFYQGKNGREESDAYFGSAWSVTARGPLPALLIAGGFAFLGGPQGSQADLSLEAWPASGDGFYIARILGILTNALAVLAAVALAGRLVPGAERVAACWLGVAPAIALDTDFLWPKLLATYFLLLAVQLILDGRPARCVGGALALAYYSHPVGGLMAPPVLLFLLLRSRRGNEPPRWIAAGRSAGAAALWLALCLLPWFAYKRWVGHPDAFYRYPLGDGRGLAPAASLASWLQCRWENFWLTLAPGGFFFSGDMQVWLEGPLSPPLRWAIGYAKALPGGLGLGCAFLAGASLLRPPPAAASGFRPSLLYASFALMLLYWGYSADGLGRNCLTPLTVLVLVFAAAQYPAWAGWRWLLLLAALESLSVRFLGVGWARGFTFRQVDQEALILGGLVVAASLAPLLLVFPGRPTASRPGGSPS